MIDKDEFWRKFTPGNLLTILVIIGGFFVTWKNESGRLSLIEYRMEQLETMEHQDFQELRSDVQMLTESLRLCQDALIRLEADMSHLLERE